LRTQLPEAVMLLAATYTATKYARMGAVFACVVVVVGGPVLAPVVARLTARIQEPRVRRIAAAVAVVLLAALASLRLFDLVSNRHYLSGTDETTFGAGLGWWFPEHAAEFIERERLPGEIFNTYDEGGYLSWKLGPARQEYIDGRDTLFGVQRIQLHSDLLQSSPDSDEWQREAARYNINTIILALGRFDGIQMIRLQDFCGSKVWQPVYLDEVSAVFVRRMPQTEDLRARFAVNCALAPLPAHPPGTGRVEAFNAWADAAAVLAALDRNTEALAATDKGLAVFPDSSFLHWQRGNILAGMGRFDESEQEYLTAIELDPNEVTWSALAASYQRRHRMPEAIDALQNAASLSPRPYQLLLKLGYLYLNERDANNAMQVFDGAARTAPKGIGAADGGTFDFMVAQGRSGAASELGDMPQAIAFQEQAAQLKPNAPEPWRRLAKLYRKAGREGDAVRAEGRASAAEVKH
jgi:tetratricopeptide (TPR) repeat protein